MTISDIVLEFATDLKTILGQNLSKIILYGSYARMDYDASSDVDSMIPVSYTHLPPYTAMPPDPPA